MRGLYLFLAMLFPEVVKLGRKSRILYHDLSVGASVLRRLAIFNSAICPSSAPSFGHLLLRRLVMLGTMPNMVYAFLLFGQIIHFFGRLIQ